jgi:methylated-DNA-[protein]-cysteine S-methyltransferase
VFHKVMTTIAATDVTFDTELGRCALSWSELGITSVLLPVPGGRRGASIGDRAEVPPFVRDAVAGMTAVLTGEAVDLRDVPLDHRGVDAFRQAVYAATRDIPAGTTRSYGEVARAIGLDRRDGAREVGAALARNPTPIIVPCHRVVGADGRLVGFSAPGGLATKRRLLEIEGALGFGQRTLFG